MQRSNLQILFDIQELLVKLNYPDFKRVSFEILDFLNKEKITKEEVFKRLKSNEPWEYIQGYTKFCNFNFFVTKDTLIPRIETEQIVYTTLDILKKDHVENIVDVGTGSGCIPISLAKLSNTPYSIYATDISQKALNIARKNEEVILNKKRINWINTDLIQDIDIQYTSFFTVNLPYIPTQQYEGLDKSVLDFEPRQALDGGLDGLQFYNKLFKQISQKDINIKYILLETESSIFINTFNLINKYFKNTEITKLKDIFNRDRYLLIRFL